jgi:DNA-binding transcriptional regulator YiaG
MTTTTAHQKVLRNQPKPKRSALARAKKLKAGPGNGNAGRTSSSSVSVVNLRSQLALTQPQFARLLSVSVRSLATLESGTAPTEPVARRLTELGRLINSLAEVIKQPALGAWLQTPNPAFDGLKPLEVIERGESDRLWEMIFALRSGVPS